MSREIVDALLRGGSIAPDQEADILLIASGEGAGPIDALVARRLQGEPIAWIAGWTEFCGVRIGVAPGVFVPRPHTEGLAQRAASLLPDDGVAIDLCTGAGAVARYLMAMRPRAAVIATDIDPVAVACARRNGVDAHLGDIAEPLSPVLRRKVDVVTAVPPYVPRGELHLLPRDVREREPAHALDGGPAGTDLLVRVAEAATQLLRPGGSVLLEIGGDQADEMKIVFGELGLSELRVHRDDEGQDRAIEARSHLTS